MPATTQTPVANPFEHIGRERKAQAIAVVVWRMIPPEYRTRSNLGESIAQLPEEERNKVALVAGTKIPSDLTWARVCAVIDEKAEEERHLIAFLERLDNERAAS